MKDKNKPKPKIINSIIVYCADLFGPHTRELLFNYSEMSNLAVNPQCVEDFTLRKDVAKLEYVHWEPLNL